MVVQTGTTRQIGEPLKIIKTDSPTARPGRPGVVVVAPVGYTGTKRVYKYHGLPTIEESTRLARVQRSLQQKRMSASERAYKQALYDSLVRKQQLFEAQSAIQRGDYGSTSLKTLKQLQQEKVVSAEQAGMIRQQTQAMRIHKAGDVGVVGHAVTFEPQFTEVKEARLVKTQEEYYSFGGTGSFSGPQVVVTTSFEPANVKLVLGGQKIVPVKGGTALYDPLKQSSLVIKPQLESLTAKKVVAFGMGLEGKGRVRTEGASAPVRVMGRGFGLALGGSVISTGEFIDYMKSKPDKPLMKASNVFDGVRNIIPPPSKDAKSPIQLAKDIGLGAKTFGQQIWSEEGAIMGTALALELAAFKGTSVAGRGLFRGIKTSATGQLIGGGIRQGRFATRSVLNARRIKKIEAWKPEFKLFDTSKAGWPSIHVGREGAAQTTFGGKLVTDIELSFMRRPVTLGRQTKITGELVDIERGVVMGFEKGKQTTLGIPDSGVKLLDVEQGIVLKVQKGGRLSEGRIDPSHLLDSGRYVLTKRPGSTLIDDYVPRLPRTTQTTGLEQFKRKATGKKPRSKKPSFLSGTKGQSKLTFWPEGTGLNVGGLLKPIGPAAETLLIKPAFKFATKGSARYKIAGLAVLQGTRQDSIVSPLIKTKIGQGMSLQSVSKLTQKSRVEAAVLPMLGVKRAVKYRTGIKTKQKTKLKQSFFGINLYTPLGGLPKIPGIERTSRKTRVPKFLPGLDERRRKKRGKSVRTSYFEREFKLPDLNKYLGGGNYGKIF